MTHATEELRLLLEKMGLAHGSLSTIASESHLGTRGRLTKNDIRFIKANTEALEKEQSIVDDCILKIQSLLPQLRCRHAKNRTAIDFQKALLVPLPRQSKEEKDFLSRIPYELSPLSTVPFEVMSHILVLAATSIDLSTESDCLDTTSNTAWILGQVCRVWRAIVLSTPSLWSLVVLNDEPNYFTLWEELVLHKYLRRSKEQLLQVVVHGMYVDTALRSALQGLCPHTHRWGSVDWTTNSSSLRFFSNIFRQSAYFPFLKSLSLTVEGSDYYDVEHVTSDAPSRLAAFHAPVEQLIEMFWEAPQLQDVLLQGIGITEITFPLARLRTFQGDIYFPQELARLFSQAPELTQATLWIKFRENHSFTDDPVAHLSLCRLSLYTDVECLQCLHLPALQHLLVEQLVSYKDGILGIEQFISHSQCQLQTLYLNVPPLSFSLLTSILEKCASTLTALSVRIDKKMADDLYQALTYNSVSCLAPHLTELFIHDDTYGNDPVQPSLKAFEYSTAALLNMLSSRRRLGSETALLKSLTLTAPHSPQPKKLLKVMRKFEREGLSIKFHGCAWMMSLEM
ncbi:uncharacterized protein EV420DRAFT_491197 [Desarmillaria tabescens]|uniref:F-box domain-containing protein n=1 Tax=Armillaria tabescens TaxID=1929756 RepID=A0AA39KA61_ARMTA|nr:uncharacterized protein EV420DRAFT_491197 [Desarmillaria tabescens]KAK0457409.1 hypothetical protein EV420DRAFT_491197 [Desarmillaria tabescens]